ncbi:TolB family protein [Elongatibacter sediminis]|uniref:Uncharacterized protein n=1 Tax=Elongatibacter sediminis TaxID=3119006 RepID=A0AAW9RDM1_9GAMM
MRSAETSGHSDKPHGNGIRRGYTFLMKPGGWLLLIVAGVSPGTVASAEPTAGTPIAPVRDSYPHLSPDGGRIVFQSNRSGSNQIWVMNQDGSGLEQLTHRGGQGAETPRWSPDGSRIVYAAYLGPDDNDVFVMDADAGNPRQVTDGPGYDDHPAWSFDGRRIVFNSDRDTPDLSAPWHERYHDIWSVELDDSGQAKNPVRHTDCRSVCTFGSLSPDGRWLLYRKVDDTPGLNWWLEAGPRNSEITIARPDGGGARLVASHPAFDGWPAWSPDGEWIVFASNRAGPKLTGQVWRVRKDDTGLQQITSGDWAHVQPAWGPDGTSLTAYRHHETEASEYGSVIVITLPKTAD